MFLLLLSIFDLLACLFMIIVFQTNISIVDSNAYNATNDDKISMSLKLRVHIAPVGFESRRVTGPLEKLRADRVYLLTQVKNDKAAEFIESIEKRVKRTSPALEVKKEHTDLWDLYACIAKFREIFIKEKANGSMIFVNVSTGSKVAAIAGTIACMLWGGSPYYQVIEYEGRIPRVEEEEKLSEKIIEVPTFPITHPRDAWLRIIDFVEQNKGQLSKKELIKALKENGVMRSTSSSGKESTKAADQSQLRALLEPMEHEFRYVTIETHGRRSIVRTTKVGEDALRIYGLKPVVSPPS